MKVCRARCFHQEWLLEIDIKGFYDNLDHDLLMNMLEKHTDDKFILLYSERFLKASGIDDEGIETIRTRGTPQGGSVSCVLANLYLHEAFDSWMFDKFPEIKFSRYADDSVVHCTNEKQAYFMKNRIESRLKAHKLELYHLP